MGHKIQWEYLRGLKKKERIAHAMLFYGEEGIGKKRVAVEFVKFLNCPNVSENSEFACQKCENCKEIESLCHPDILLIEPEGKEIKIEKTRELKSFLSTSALKSPFKVGVIDNAHHLNKEAQNSLLKTIEEPKGQALLILISSHPDQLLPTISSRVQKISFHPLSPKEAKKELAKKIRDKEILKKAVFLSEGKQGKIVEFIKNPDLLNKELKKYMFMQNLFEAEFEKRIVLIKKISEKENSSERFEQMLWFMARYLRMIFLKKIGVREEFFLPISHTNQKLELYSLNKIKKMVEDIEKLKELASWSNIDLRLALENFLLSI